MYIVLTVSHTIRSTHRYIVVVTSPHTGCRGCTFTIPCLCQSCAIFSSLTYLLFENAFIRCKINPTYPQPQYGRYKEVQTSHFTANIYMIIRKRFNTSMKMWWKFCHWFEWECCLLPILWLECLQVGTGEVIRQYVLCMYFNQLYSQILQFLHGTWRDRKLHSSLNIAIK